MRRYLASLAIASLATVAAAQSPLTTLFAYNNAGSVGGAVYFDLVLTAPITITAIDVNAHFGTAGGVPGSLDVLTVAGGRAGQMGNVGAWVGPQSLLNPLVTAASNTPTVCTSFSPLSLPVGTWGVCLRANGFDHGYTNGTGANQTYTNGPITLNAGEADNVPFSGGLFTPRVVNCNIHYSSGGSGTVLATATPYGTGCVSRYGSFYEEFASPASYDLSGSAMTMIFTGTGYTMVPGITAFVPPSGGATSLALTDDSEAVVNLASPFPHPLGNAATLNVCSNGYVSLASNGVAYTPVVANALSFANSSWGNWHDFLPNATNNVMFEQIGSTSYVTWNAVPDFGSASTNTWQIQFDRATGMVHFVWVSMSLAGNAHLVFYSPSGPSVNPGNRDISATLPGTFSTGSTDITPLQLAVSPRPIINTVINFTTSNITPTTPFGAVALGLTQYGVPIDLTSIGMASCFQYHDILATFLYLPFGASSVVTPFNVPNMVGLHVQAQSYNYDPAAGLTTLGAVSSRAFDLGIGDF